MVLGLVFVLLGELREENLGACRGVGLLLIPMIRVGYICRWAFLRSSCSIISVALRQAKGDRKLTDPLRTASFPCNLGLACESQVMSFRSSMQYSSPKRCKSHQHGTCSSQSQYRAG